MSNSERIDTRASDWLQAETRRRRYAQSLETEELADLELDNQLRFIKDVASVRSGSFEDILVKLSLWKQAAFPEGTDLQENDPEHILVFSAILDLQAFVESGQISDINMANVRAA